MDINIYKWAIELKNNYMYFNLERRKTFFKLFYFIFFRKTFLRKGQNRTHKKILINLIK